MSETNDGVPFRVQLRGNIPPSDLVFPEQTDLKHGPLLGNWFAITPANRWSKAERLKAYQVDRTQFKRGQFVYVANDDTFKNQAPGRAEGESRFVARILDLRKDVKEEVSQTTYAVVAWAYKPRELQGDASRTFRKRPSIDNELILSDHVDIVNAESISDHAQVEHWSPTQVRESRERLFHPWRFGYRSGTQTLCPYDRDSFPRDDSQNFRASAARSRKRSLTKAAHLSQRRRPMAPMDPTGMADGYFQNPWTSGNAPEALVDATGR